MNRDTKKKAVMIAAKFYEARDSFKVVFRESYPERVNHFQGVIREKMKAWNVDEIHATMRCMEILGERMPDPGMAQAWFMVACLELLEPQPPESGEAPSVPGTSERIPCNDQATRRG